MRVLVIGAGVIGSVYAGQLAQAGHDVVLLARGTRLGNLQHAGLRLQRQGRGVVCPPVVIAAAPPAGPIDLTIVAVRRDQAVAAAHDGGRMPGMTVLLFGNNAGLLADLAVLFGTERTIAGFPGIGGRLDEDRVTYTLIKQQPTMVSPVGGSSAARCRTVAHVLPSAGFPTALESNAEGWLASHAALVVPMAAAIQVCGGSASALAHRTQVLWLAVGTTRAIYNEQSIA